MVYHILFHAKLKKIFMEVIGGNILKKKNKPPSRIKYENNNPVWSVRLTKELYIALNNFLRKSIQSRKEFIEIALNKKEAKFTNIIDQESSKGYKDGYDQGYKTGKNEKIKEVANEYYQKAIKEYGITIPCNECNEEIFLLPDSDWHKLIIEFCKCRNLAHAKCPEK